MIRALTIEVTKSTTRFNACHFDAGHELWNVGSKSLNLISTSKIKLKSYKNLFLGLLSHFCSQCCIEPLSNWTKRSHLIFNLKLKFKLYILLHRFKQSQLSQSILLSISFLSAVPFSFSVYHWYKIFINFINH